MDLSDLKCRGYYYLASRYSSPSAGERAFRAQEAREYMAHLLREGLFIYSPIVSLHDLATAHDFPTEFESWADFNKIFLLPSAGMIIAATEGWQKSLGVQHEIRQCRELGKKMFLFNLSSKLVMPHA